MDSYTAQEVMTGIIGIGITAAFGGWAAVVKRGADQMTRQIERAINELQRLREEIHRDRLMYERRFSRLESHVGIDEQPQSL
jgi:hypothetical protein